jgi:hypothetical protein
METATEDEKMRESWTLSMRKVGGGNGDWGVAVGFGGFEKKKLNSPAPSLPEEERGAVIAVLNGLYVNRPLVTEALGSSLGCVKLGP